MTTTPGAPTITTLPGEVTRQVLHHVFTTGQPIDHPDPAFTGTPQWLLADLTDGRIVGADHGHGWIRSDQLTHHGPTTAPLHPDSDPTWRVWTIRIFNAAGQLLIRPTPNGYTGWYTTDPTPPPENLTLHPRTRVFLLGVDATATTVPTPDDTPPFTLLRERDGRQTLLPLPFQPATPAVDDDHPAAGTWLSTREYFTADPATAAVGVTAHRYLDLTTGNHPGHPQ